MLNRRLRNDFDRYASEIDVTRSQWSVIAVVSRMPGTSQRSIAELLEMSEASAGRLIDRLCADGLLERRELPGDRRTRAVYLTEAAQPLLDRIGDIAKRSETRLFRGFANDELEMLLGYLERIHNNVDGE